LREADKIPYKQLEDAYKAQRAAIRADGRLSPTQKQQMYMLARLTMQKKRDQLNEHRTAQNAARREMMPQALSWRAWVEQQAALGDEAAISALRGMVYQDGRDLKKKLARDEALAEQNAIQPAFAQDSDPQVRKLSDLIWKVGKNGNVQYTFTDGLPAFRDEGDRLTFGRVEVSDDALALTLRYGADKWRDGINITGGDAVFKERAVRHAVAMGIKVKNIELRALEQQIKAEMEAIAKLSAAPAKDVAPSTLMEAVSLRDDDIESLVRGINGKARMLTKVEDGKNYVGPIVAQNAKYIAQHTGRNTFVLHERAAFDVTPEHGAQVTVRYRNGTATTTAAKGRGERESR
jgi:hypothetical protein